MQHDFAVGQAIEYESNGEQRPVMILDTEWRHDGYLDADVEVLDNGSCTGVLETLIVDTDKRLVWKDDDPSQMVTYTHIGYHLPPLPEHIEHRCTDTLCLAIFLLALAGVGWIAVYAVSRGDLRRLNRAYDYEGNVCGVDPNQTGKNYAFWCADETTGQLMVHLPVCVEECPCDFAGGNCTDDIPCLHPERSMGLESQRAYRTRHFGNSPWCWPREKKLAKQAVAARWRYAGPVGKTLMAMPRHYEYLVLLSLGSALAMALFYFKLMEKAVECVVMTFVFFFPQFLVVVGSWVLLLYTQGWYGNGKDSSFPWWSPVIIAVGLLILFHLLTEGLKETLRNVIGCIEAAVECITQETSLFFEPVVALILRIGIIVLMSAIIVFLLACGETRKGESGPKTHYRQMEWIYLGYLLAMLVYLMEFCTSLSQYVLAWVTQRWYFTPYDANDRKPAWKKYRGIFKGYAHTFNKHVGTIALGSLLILVCRPFRIGSRGCRWLARQGPCRPLKGFWECVYDRFEPIHRNAYLGVALTSENFLLASRSAEHMLSSSRFHNVKLLRSIQWIFQFSGLVFITAASLAAVKLFSARDNNFFKPRVPGLHISRQVDMADLIAVLVSFPIGLSYMTVFDTVGDVVLYCWVVHTRRWDYQVESRRKSTQHKIPGALGTLLPWAFGQDVQEEMGMIRYAPPSLQDLVTGNRRKPNCLPSCLAGTGHE